MFRTCEGVPEGEPVSELWPAPSRAPVVGWTGETQPGDLCPRLVKGDEDVAVRIMLCTSSGGTSSAVMACAASVKTGGMATS